jgi:hypothetical protein
LAVAVLVFEEWQNSRQRNSAWRELEVCAVQVGLKEVEAAVASFGEMNPAGRS